MRSPRMVITLLTITILSSVVIFGCFLQRIEVLDELPIEDYNYHFALIIPEIDSFQWNLFQKGALAYARQNRIALEIHEPGSSNIKEQERYLEFAVLSKVDGIITSVPNGQNFNRLLHKASNWNIPVISLDFLANETPEYVRYIGIDPYELGIKTGEALLEARGTKANYIVLTNPQLHSETFDKEFQRGLHKTLEGFSQIKLFPYVANRSISAEEQTYDILKNYPEVNTIICVNSKDTLGSTRVVVDLNRVNDTIIIGNGLTPEIARYIKRGVIYGTVTTNPFHHGRNSVAALQAFREGWLSNNLTSVSISLITQSNLSRYNRDYHLGGITE